MSDAFVSKWSHGLQSVGYNCCEECDTRIQYFQVKHERKTMWEKKNRHVWKDYVKMFRKEMWNGSCVCITGPIVRLFLSISEIVGEGGGG